MAIDNKRLAESLKILAENPGKIEAEKRKYNDRMAEIKAEEAKGIWSPNAIKEKRARALEDRDRVCHALAHSMRSALDTVKANNDYSSVTIDLDNKKLQTALSMVSLMGEKMTYNDQLGVLAQFRGDPASLRVLEAAFAKNGQDWAAKNAREMQKTISEQAINEMSVVLTFHEYAEQRGRFDFPIEKARWTRGEFGKQAERMGFDIDGVSDPFLLAIDMTMDSLEEQDSANMEESDPVKATQARAKITAQRLKLAAAKQEIANAAKTGKDPAEIFNRALSTVEKANPAEMAASGPEA